MTRLLDKIHSYNIKLGMDFNETFSGSGPTEYGAYNFNSAYISILNNNNGIISSLTDGPFPGQGSWSFRGNGSNQSSRIRFGNASIESTIGSDYIRNENYTFGFWFRINAPITTLLNTVRNISQFINTDLGDGEKWRQGFWFAYLINNNIGDPNYGKYGLNLYTAGHDYFIYQDGHGKDFEIGKWYFLAVRKTRPGTTNTTVTFNYYIDGISVASNTYTNVDTSTTFHVYGSGVTDEKDFSVSSAFFGSSSDLTATVLQDIYKYGAPIQVPVKYYDGSAWQTSSNQKIYNGTSWIPMYANIWDGTQWLPL